MKYKFPDGFLWGGAVSGTQTEGTGTTEKGENIWDYWYRLDKTKFWHEVGPNIASDFYHKYKEDAALMQEIGFNSFRTAISWSRLIPDGDGKICQSAVDYYNDVIDTMISKGIEPMMNLYHFDMPMEMQKIGGFENRYVVDAYVRYAETCFKLFGDRVKYFATHNEPIVVVECGYIHQFHYPCVVDMERAMQVLHNIMMSSALAIQKYKALGLDGKIGIILNLSPTYPRDVENDADVAAARLADLIANRSFLNPSVKGAYPEALLDFLKAEGLMFKYHPDDMQIIAENTVDYLGVNYYQPRRIKAKEHFVRKDMMLPEDYFDFYDMPGKKINPHRGWEIYEPGIYDIAKLIQNEYGNIDWFISENGMGVEGEEKFLNADGMIEDDYRIEFVQAHLRYLHQAIEEGANCFGYHMWAAFDCWSWLNAYKNRYGFIRVDIENNCKRSIKKSGYWLKEVSRNNGF